MQESPASWAALQDLYSQLRSFEAAYRAACSAPELCGRIDPRAQRQYEDLTELRDVVHHRLLRVWIAHPEGSDRVDTRVTLEWEAAAQRRYPFTISPDRKSTRLNSSHSSISYAVFCLKKNTNKVSSQNLNRQSLDSFHEKSYSYPF